MTTTSSRRLIAPLLLAMALAALSITGGTRLAAAHDALAQAVPAAGDTVTTDLSSVTLTFSEAPMSEFASALILRVTGPSGGSITTGTPEAEGTTLTTQVSVVEAGAHTVAWQSVSSDGHPISGSYTFTYAGPLPTSAPVSPSPDAAETPVTTENPSSSQMPVASDESPGASGGVGSGGAGPLVAGVAVSAALLAGILVALRYARLRRRRLGQDRPASGAGSDA